MSAAANVIVPAVVIGGGVYVLSRGEGAAPAAPGATTYPPSPGSTIGQAVASGGKSSSSTIVGVIAQKGNIVYLNRDNASSAAAPSPTQFISGWNYASGGQGLDPELQKKIDFLESAAAEQFKNMDEVAKSKAADAINKEFGTKLNGHEDWKTISSVVAGAAGAAAGAALCGPICGKVGAIVGAYLGAKLGDLLAKKWPEIKAWVAARWAGAKEWVEQAWGDVSGGAAGAIDQIIDFFNPF